MARLINSVPALGNPITPKNSYPVLKKVLEQGSNISLTWDDAALTVTIAAAAAGTAGDTAKWGQITGTLTDQADLTAALGAKANLAGGNTFTDDQVIQATVDDYVTLAFHSYTGAGIVTMWGGTNADPTFYVDAHHIVLEDETESHVFLDMSAAEVDIKANNVTKISVVSTGPKMPGLVNAANDSAAATAGVPVSGLYRNGSVLMIRVA